MDKNLLNERPEVANELSCFAQLLVIFLIVFVCWLLCFMQAEQMFVSKLLFLVKSLLAESSQPISSLSTKLLRLVGIENHVNRQRGKQWCHAACPSQFRCG